MSPERTGATLQPAGVAVQLWSVRDALAEDFGHTLAAIADMGVDGVELADNYGPYAGDPEGLLGFLDGLGLQITSAHVDFERLSESALADTVEFFRKLGVSTLIIPYDERAWDPARVDELIGDLNAASAALAASGLRIGFHNHDREFGAFGSGTFWDHIATHTNADVVLQLDIGWAVYAGQLPEQLFRRYPGRIVSAHYKVTPRPNSDRSPILGDDDYDWRGLTDVALSDGGLDWVIVEQETYPQGLSSLESVAASWRGLDRALRR